MRIVRKLGMCSMLGAALSAAAQPSLSAWSDRERVRVRLEGLSEPDLKFVYLRCSEASEQGLLTFEEAARCSLAHEVLKQRVFRGDFQALLSWWRLHQGGSSAGGTAAGR
jgi:hypothetical protein